MPSYMIFDGRWLTWLRTRPRLFDTVEHRRYISTALEHGIVWQNGMRKAFINRK